MAEKKFVVRYATQGGSQVTSEADKIAARVKQTFYGITLSQKSATDSANAFEDALREEERAFDQLRASIDPAYAATKRYEAAVAAATRAVKLGAATQDQANAVIAQARARLDTFEGAVGTAGRGLKGMQGQIQNAAFQVGDFAVQVGAGTAVSTALAQQLPQLIGGFGVLGAVIGAGVAIGVPLLTAYFRDNKEEAVSLEDAIGAVTSAMDDYRDAATLALQSTGQLQEEFGSFADEIRRAADYMAEVKLGILLDNMQAAIDPLKGGLADIVGLMDQFRQKTDQFMAAAAAQPIDPVQLQMIADFAEDYAAKAQDAAAALGLNVDQALLLASALSDLGNATGVDEIGQKAAVALALIQQFAPAGAALSPELAAAADYLNQLVQEAGRTEAAIDGAASSAAMLPGSFNAAAAGASGLFGVVSSVASAAWDAAAALLTMSNMGSAYNNALGDDERGSQRDARNMATNGLGDYRASLGLAEAQRRASAAMRSATASGGASPGGASNPADGGLSPWFTEEQEKQITDLAKTITDAQEAVNASIEKGTDAVANFLFALGDGADAAKKSLSDLLMQMAAVQLKAGLTSLAGSSSWLGTAFAAIGTALTGTPTAVPVGANATGTDYWKGGPTWVGERGPEILNLPRGSQIMNANKSAKMAGGGVEIVVRSDPGTIVEIVRNTAGAMIRQAQPETVRQSVAATGALMTKTKKFGNR